jgi:archaetidylinositol phosphate synthase
MNITALRGRFIHYLEPLAVFFAKMGFSPNQVSVLSLICGILTAILYAAGQFFIGSVILIFSAVLDLVDGNVARMVHKETKFGAVFDWIVDKYTDALVLIGIGLSGCALFPSLVSVPQTVQTGIIGFAIAGSLLNTFIKPVVYAEIGYQERKDGKIEDPLEGIGFFGRPETIIVLVAGGLTGFIGISVLIIAICTNLSAIQRIVYLYRRFS